MAGNAFSGRKPKLSSVKKLSGQAVPCGHAGSLPVPDWLCEEAAALFQALASELDALSLMTRLDAEALAQYCEAAYDYRRFTRCIHTLNAQAPHSADFVIADSGYQSLTALQTLRDKAQKRADVLGRQFGFTPLSRRALQDQIRTQEEADATEQKFFKKA